MNFTSGYYDFEINFSIQKLNNYTLKNLPLSIYLTEKIILRGIPSKPSSFLINKLKKKFPEQQFENTIKPYFINDKPSNWSEQTILGNNNNPSDNPALFFFKNLKVDLKDYGFITKLIIPEFIIAKFCPDLKKEGILNHSTRADFFIPNCLLAIEIDGFQHQNTKNEDIKRDEALEKFGIQTIRISSKSVREKDDQYFKKISLIYDRLSKSQSLKHYKDNFENKSYSKENYSSVITAICRLQVLIIQLIKQGHLLLDSKEWRININTDLVCSFNWAKLAFEDLIEWWEPLIKLYDEKIVIPETTFTFVDHDNPKSDCLRINFFLYERKDEFTYNNITVLSSYLNKIKSREKNPHEIHDIFLDYVNLKPRDSNLVKINNPSSIHKKKALQKLLYQLFGYEDFKDGQLSIMSRIFQQGNTLGLLPTGGGKSLCFQLPSILQLGCTVVISPIKALMRDHVEELNKIGFEQRSAFINSETTKWERQNILERVREGKIHFLTVSPERFQIYEFRETIKQLSNDNLLSYIVIDEVHCLSEWGHDFRTSYLALSHTIFSVLELKNPIISLTATASLTVLENIKAELRLNNDDIIYKMHNSRDELNFKVIETEKDNKFNKLDKIVLQKKVEGKLSNDASGIVFTPHINWKFGCFPLEQDIKKKYPSLKTGIFCGDQPKKWTSKNNLSPNSNFEDYKNNTQKKFKDNKLALMFATKAFGMGINKSNIYLSVHYCMPSSLESLYQEAGRTGRDGKNAENIILFSDESEPIPQNIFLQNTNLENLKKYADDINGGDFKKQLFLSTNTPTKSKCLEDCLRILSFLERQNRNTNQITTYHEQNLYRLFQLGLIYDWTVIDFHKNIYEVKYKALADIEIIKNILKEIGKYQKSKSEMEKHKHNLKLIITSGTNVEKKAKLIDYLLQWNYDHFVYNRRQSLKTLYDYCKEFKAKGPEDFKQKIDSYFRLDDKAYTIGQHLELDFSKAPLFLDDFLRTNDELIPNEQVNDLIFTLARYLESYENNPWLDLLSSMCRLITKSFDNPDGKARLFHFISEAKKNSKNWKVTLENFLNFSKILNKDEKLLLSQSIEPYLEDIDELIMLHKYLQDDYSAITYLNKVNNRLNNVF